MRFPAAVLAALAATLLACSAPFASASAWTTSAPVAASAGVTYDFISQPLNHSDHSQGSFLQRIVINNEFAPDADANAPAFVYVGGQSALGPSAVTSGFIHTVAKTHGARIFALEHRYYGESLARKYLSTGDLRYLTVQNAVDDLAGFIDIYTAAGKPLSAGHVVLFGSEYGGTLAAYLRVRYPKLTVAAVAASATVRPVSAFLEYGDNLLKLVADLWNGPFNCAGTLEAGLKDLRMAMYDKQKHDIGRVTEAFRACSEAPDFESPFFIQEAVVAAVSQVITGYLSQAGIDEMCGILNQKAPSTEDNRPLWALGRFITAATAKAGKSCFALNREALSAKYQSSIVEDHKVAGHRQSLYLECTALGTFPSSNGYYSAEAPYFDSLCYDVFGMKEALLDVANNQAILEREFGGLSYKGRRVYFANSQIDPYNSPRLTVFKSNIAEGIYAVESKGVTRGAFLGAETGGSLKVDRERAATQIAAWLNVARAIKNEDAAAEAEAEVLVPVAAVPAAGMVSEALLRILKL